MKFRSALLFLGVIIVIISILYESLVSYLFDFKIEPAENSLDIIKSHGYPTEQHETITEDGYILTIHRMPNKNSKYLPIFLMHGMFGSSADWINVYPNNSLGYILWDAGFDVWIGNARGNGNSRSHSTIDKKENPKAFYNFSFHEIGVYDVTAMIDYVLKSTNQSQLYYVGFSQGGTSFYVGMSLRPEYNKKIRLASLLAPVGFARKMPFPLFRMMYRYVDKIQSYTDTKGSYSMHLDSLRCLSRSLLRKSWHKTVRYFYYQLGAGFADDEQLTKESLELIMRTVPRDVSVRQVYHYLQGIKLGRFCHYDQGPKMNEKLYGCPEPPNYNLTQIEAPVAIYYSKNDIYNDVKDIQDLVKLLPNVVKDYLVPYEKFNHADFLFALDTKRIVYDRMIDLIKQF